MRDYHVKPILGHYYHVKLIDERPLSLSQNIYVGLQNLCNTHIQHIYIGHKIS